MRNTWLLFAPLLSSLLLSACGGGGGSDGSGLATMAALATAGTSTAGVETLVSVNAEALGANCASGGVRIEAGPDSDGNGVLAASEVGSTQYVCHGTPGANGSDGAYGVDGTNGTNGLTTLVNIVSEAAGANCISGGSKVETGLDGNRSGVLEVGEVSATNYICNGALGASLAWVDVTGTAVQAQSNTGYVARNDTAQVVVTLPANPAIGDVVRVSGVGAGGWRIAQNAGQSIYTKNVGGVVGETWTAHESNQRWRAIASSADGSKLVAVADFGQIHTSTDSGVSWTAHGSNQRWRAIASSADGSKLVAAVDGGQIYTSTDSGVSWTERESNRNWRSVASSADGSRLVAVAEFGQIYTSTDTGVSWTARESGRTWSAVASSADGTKLVAVEYDGQIYTSIDGGVNWTARESRRYWWSVASSADGSRLVALVNFGQIYTSSDGGANWAARESGQNWESVASSADGTKLVAVVYPGGQIYTSIDSGVSWTARASNRNWRSVASSADGSKLAVLVMNGQIYTSTTSTMSGTGGSISGAAHDAIELQYVGGGMFTVLSHEGSLTIQ